jgi:DNA polymerase-3 subunit delta
VPNFQPSSNIFLFFGEDNFSIQRKIDHWKTEFAKKYSATAITQIDSADFSETEIIKNLQGHLSPSLFASKKLIIIRDGLPTKATQTLLIDYLLQFEENVPKDFFVIFWQTQKVDGRLSFTKKFKSLVSVTEFNLPKGVMLNQWIKAMTKTLGASISDQAADKLAQFLGRDWFEEKNPTYNLWQVHSELLKLTSKLGPVEVNDVENLVKPKIPDSVFNLTDQLVKRSQKGSFQAMENFLATQTAEEKTSMIKIIALLSDQLRSLLIVSLLTKEGLNQDRIAEKLGWTSGRVFVTSKNAQNVSIGLLKTLLARLLFIDQKIKTSDTNQKLELDLFLASAAQ